MKKSVVLYKKLSAALMARLHEQAEVTLIDALDEPGLAKLREALPTAHGLLGASLRLDAQLLDLGAAPGSGGQRVRGGRQLRHRLPDRNAASC